MAVVGWCWLTSSSHACSYALPWPGRLLRTTSKTRADCPGFASLVAYGDIACASTRQSPFDDSTCPLRSKVSSDSTQCWRRLPLLPLYVGNSCFRCVQPRVPVSFRGLCHSCHCADRCDGSSEVPEDLKWRPDGVGKVCRGRRRRDHQPAQLS